MRTSSSLRIGSERVLCLALRSFERPEDIILRRTEEGAEKCALRDLRREEETSGLYFIFGGGVLEDGGRDGEEDFYTKVGQLHSHGQYWVVT